MIKGKFVYMSPEQSLAKKLDKRSDIFAIGISLYEMLTGINPFHKNNIVLTLEAVQRYDPPPPSQYDPVYPPLDPSRAQAGPPPPRAAPGRRRASRPAPAAAGRAEEGRRRGRPAHRHGWRGSLAADGGAPARGRRGSRRHGHAQAGRGAPAASAAQAG